MSTKYIIGGQRPAPGMLMSMHRRNRLRAGIEDLTFLSPESDSPLLITARNGRYVVLARPSRGWHESRLVDALRALMAYDRIDPESKEIWIKACLRRFSQLQAERAE